MTGKIIYIAEIKWKFIVSSYNILIIKHLGMIGDSYYIKGPDSVYLVFLLFLKYSFLFDWDDFSFSQSLHIDFKDSEKCWKGRNIYPQSSKNKFYKKNLIHIFKMYIDLIEGHKEHFHVKIEQFQKHLLILF